jgi:hypothetical protein
MRRIIPREKQEPASKPVTVDHVKALILERAVSLRVSAEDCAKAMGAGLGTWYNRRHQPSDLWQLGEILRLAEFLGISIDELRTAVRYERNRRRQ